MKEYTKDIIEWTLLITLITAIIYAQVDGRFIHREINLIEICNGIPTENSMRYYLLEHNMTNITWGNSTWNKTYTAWGVPEEGWKE